MKNRFIKKTSIFTLFCFIFFISTSGFPVKQDSEEKGLKLLKEGEALFENYQYQEALAKFNQAKVYLKEKENLAKLYLLMSRLYYETGDKIKTESTLRDMLKLDPGKTIIEKEYPLGFVRIYQKLKDEFKSKITAVKINGENGTIEKPGKRKKKKFPTLLVVGGIIVVGILVYFLLIKKTEKYTLTVSKGEGINGTPESGYTQYEKGTTVNYSYSAQAGYSDLKVLLDGVAVAASGSVKMDKNHSLTATTEELGSIRVESDPGSAAIWLDGVDTGRRTNNTLTNVVPGSHIVKLVKTGYDDWEQTVTVTSGQQVTVNATLVKFNSGITWIKVSAGEFEMGTKGADPDEVPAHEVYLDTYYISHTEITFNQYDKFCESTSRNKPSDEGWGRGSRPVVNVSWDDAKAFCDWLSSKTGWSIRLPTEAEWEFAARGGNKSKGYKFSGSNVADSVGWYRDNSGGKSQPVGWKQANELGIYDMSGNVWEWCSDWYSDTYYSVSPRSNPTGPSSGTQKVRRGGSWNDFSGSLRALNRLYQTPSIFQTNIGFRVVRD